MIRNHHAKKPAEFDEQDAVNIRSDPLPKNGPHQIVRPLKIQKN